MFTSSGENLNIEVTTVNGVTTYKVNGKEYRSLEELSPEVRNIIARIQSGQISESAPCEEKQIDIQMTTINGKTVYKVDGKTYRSFEEMPEKARRVLSGLDPKVLDSHSGLIVDAAKVPGRTGKDIPKSVESFELGGEKIFVAGAADGPVHPKYLPGAPPKKPGEAKPAISSNPGLRAAITEQRRILAGQKSLKESRRTFINTAGRIVNLAIYLALIAWSYFEPATVAPFVFVGYLLGDFVSWCVFTFWGMTKGIVNLRLKAFGLQLTGFAYLIVFLFKDNAFQIPAGHAFKARVTGLMAFFAALTIRLVMMGLEASSETDKEY